MSAVFKIAVLCFIGTVLAVFLKKDSPEISFLLALAVCMVVIMVLGEVWQQIQEFLESIVDWSGIPTDIFSPLVKTLAIALISRVGADLFRDTGQSAMAGLLEMAGAFGAIVVSLPLFIAVWEMLQTML